MKITLGVKNGEVLVLRVDAYLGAGVRMAGQLRRELGMDLREELTADQRQSITNECIKSWGLAVVCEAHRWVGRQNAATVASADGYAGRDLVAYRSILIVKKENGTPSEELGDVGATPGHPRG